jgi:hypothetical protein
MRSDCYCVGVAAEEQYHEWRRLLRELYENETGLEVPEPAAVEASAATPTQ